MTNFAPINSYIAYGTPPAEGWRPIAECPLLIMVGVTGVGKSTTIEALCAHDLPIVILPDRRQLTDELIIAQLQREDGVAVERVRDRDLRFAYTRRFRQRFAGGMAHALSQLLITESALEQLFLFDGLRGANEVAHAAALLPLARFVALDAPDFVRVQRLLGRNDAFDQVSGRAEAATASQHALPVSGAEALFQPAEVAALLQLVERGETTLDLLRAKLQIVWEERKNYDPAATLQTLRQAAPARSLIIDTTRRSPTEAAWQIAQFIAL